MVHLDQQVIALTSGDGRLRVEFQWQHDRFAHRILLDQVQIACSVEGDASEDWPDSPPLQQLSLEKIKGTDMILGVGSAGRSHWSLSVALETGQKADHSIRFDLASRCRERTTAIRSTYLATDSVRFDPADEARIDDRREPSGSGQISIHPGESSNEALVDPAGPATFRWSYRIHPI